jgi:hypothetical protein
MTDTRAQAFTATNNLPSHCNRSEGTSIVLPAPGPVPPKKLTIIGAMRCAHVWSAMCPQPSYTSKMDCGAAWCIATPIVRGVSTSCLPQTINKGILSSTVLITALRPPRYFYAATRAKWQASGDEASEAECHRGDRVRHVPLHRCQSRAGGSLWVR